MANRSLGFFMVILLLIIFAASGLSAQFHRPMMGYPPQQPHGRGLPQESEDEPDSGNWYEKLRWWKEAKRLYTEDVHDAMEQVRSLAASYDEKKKQLYSQLDDYYRSIPVARLAAAPIITGHIEEIKKELEPLTQEKAAAPKKEERERAAVLEEQIKKLEMLKDDFEQFNTMINRLHEAYDDVYVQQIHECDNYDERALESYERIEKVLDDEKARHYYDLVENSLENIRAILQYLRGPFIQFSDQAWAKIQQFMPKIRASIAELDKQGIPIRVLTEKEKAEREAIKKQKEAERLKAEAEKRAEAERQAMPWWKRFFYAIGSFFSSIGRTIARAFSWITALFSREPEPKEARKVPRPLTEDKATAKPSKASAPAHESSVPSLPLTSVDQPFPSAMPMGGR